MRIRCAIADDEPIARKIVEKYVSQLPQLELVATCGNAFEVLELLQKTDIQLLFLDINMPNFSGISLVRSLQKRPEIILTTAYSEYALEGFELAVTDYLLKPFSLERFIKAINKAQENLQLKSNLSTTPPQVSIAQEEPAQTHITVKVLKKMIRLALTEIHYAEGYGNYIKIFLDKKMFMPVQTLTEFERLVPESDFIRIHRSYIINYKHLKAVEANIAYLPNKELPIGKKYREGLIKRVKSE